MRRIRGHQSSHNLQYAMPCQFVCPPNPQQPWCHPLNSRDGMSVGHGISVCKPIKIAERTNPSGWRRFVATPNSCKNLFLVRADHKKGKVAATLKYVIIQRDPGFRRLTDNNENPVAVFPLRQPVWEQ